MKWLVLIHSELKFEPAAFQKQLFLFAGDPDLGAEVLRLDGHRRLLTLGVLLQHLLEFGLVAQGVPARIALNGIILQTIDLGASQPLTVIVNWPALLNEGKK